jgi:hypothetical protein
MQNVLNWTEIRDRAVKFTRDWKTETREAGEYQTFWNEFFEVFGVKRRSVAIYQKAVEKISGDRGAIDLFWPGTLVVEHKSAGKNLESAFLQANDYMAALPEGERPRYVIVSDYRRIRLYDLEGESGKTEQHEFEIGEFPKRIRLFSFVAGYEVRAYHEESPLNRKAVRIVVQLHRALAQSNYPKEHLSRLLVRLVFCFFADDTGIFPKDAFHNFLFYATDSSGKDFGAYLGEVFQILDTKENERQGNLDEDLASLPYVDGPLFNDALPLPFFNKEMRQAVLESARFDWGGVSPVVFGSMFQFVMDAEDEDIRHDFGAHYTSEKNISKVIDGLFLDDLKAELEAAGMNAHKLNELWDKIGAMTLFDPACGCGNFLVVAYRELRKLELEILKRLYRKEVEGSQAALPLDVAHLSKLSVESMFGIELLPFPADIARLSLWLVDHLANVELGDLFGKQFANLPLVERPHILCGNALTTDWQTLIPKEKLSYILGNPPFLGHHLQTIEQKEELRATLHNLPTVGVMDYVSAWYVKAAEYIKGTKIKCAFVSTNSITQGEQVGILWGDLLLSLHIQIHFAHRTFKWNNEAPGQAAVFCVIIGFAAFPPEHPRLFDYVDVRSEPHEVPVSRINPYLVDAPDMVIRNRQKPLCDVPEMKYGNKATDGGFLILSEDERKHLLTIEPEAEKFIKRYLGAEDFLNGGQRWCLWLVGADPENLRSLPEVMKRVEMVRTFRSISKAASTRDYPYPTLFRQVTQPESDYILIPRVSSESRRYIPIGFCPKENIISDSCQALPDASLYHFGVLESEMHMAWMRVVCGRLKSDYRYSKDIVYNNFPWPENPSEEKVKAIEAAAQKVLDARAAHPGATLADLYDPLAMPKDLLDAHKALDEAVDRAYGTRHFKTEQERLEYLFELYKQYIAAETSILAKKRKPQKAHA